MHSAAIRPDPFAPYRILRTKVPGLRPGHDLSFSGRMAALIYRAYEFEKLVSVTKLCQFPPDLEIEIASSAINAMKVILVSVLTHGNVNLSVHEKEIFVA